MKDRGPGTAAKLAGPHRKYAPNWCFSFLGRALLLFWIRVFFGYHSRFSFFCCIYARGRDGVRYLRDLSVLAGRLFRHYA